MMSDRNDTGPPVGRGQRGGYPAGAVTGETFNWWKQHVKDDSDSIIVSAHHHMLKETTVATEHLLASIFALDFKRPVNGGPINYGRISLQHQRFKRKTTLALLWSFQQIKLRVSIPNATT